MLTHTEIEKLIARGKYDAAEPAPGPYVLRSRSVSDNSLVIFSGRNEIACLRDGEKRDYSHEDKVAMATGRLLAASDAMLMALIEVSGEIALRNKTAGETIVNPAVTAMVRGAIAEAMDPDYHDNDVREEMIAKQVAAFVHAHQARIDANVESAAKELGL